MTLPAVVGSRDEIPTGMEDHYRESSDGNWFLDVKGADNLPGVLGLVKTKNDLLGEKKALQLQLEAFKGVDLDRWKELTKLEEEGKLKGGDVDKKIRELVDRHTAELTAVRDAARREIQEAQSASTAATEAAQRYFQTSSIVSGLAEARGKPKLLSSLLKERTKVVLDNGEFRLQVVDKNGQPRIKDSAGAPFELSDLIEEFRSDPETAVAFESSGRSGSGAEGGNNRGANRGTAGGTIDARDSEAFSANLEGIASGKVKAI